MQVFRNWNPAKVVKEPEAPQGHLILSWRFATCGAYDRDRADRLCDFGMGEHRLPQGAS